MNSSFFDIFRLIHIMCIKKGFLLLILAANFSYFFIERKIYMKPTGIVRRIDDLGRIVIPKEIRRQLRLHEGDPLEICISDNNEIILSKYKHFPDNIWETARQLLDCVISDYDYQLFDHYGDTQIIHGLNYANVDTASGAAENCNDLSVYRIMTESTLLAYFAIKDENCKEQALQAREILKTYLQNAETL